MIKTVLVYVEWWHNSMQPAGLPRTFFFFFFTGFNIRGNHLNRFLHSSFSLLEPKLRSSIKTDHSFVYWQPCDQLPCPTIIKIEWKGVLPSQYHLLFCFTLYSTHNFLLWQNGSQTENARYSLSTGYTFWIIKSLQKYMCVVYMCVVVGGYFNMI